MTPTSVIREMEPEDRDAVIGLIHELNLFEHRLNADRATDRQAARACFAENDRLIQAQGGAHLVAEQAGKVIGYLCCGLVEGGAYIRPELRRHLYIMELVVAAPFRGGGVGRALVEAAEAFARAQGVRMIAVGALAANAGAGRLYERAGFTPYMIDRLKRLD